MQIEKEVIEKILKETYLEVSNAYDVSDLKSDGDKVACVASKFRQVAIDKLNEIN